MTPRAKDLATRICLTLGLLYGVLALQSFAQDHDPASTGFVQSLLLGWAFTMTAVVATIVPGHPRPPHLDRV